MLNWRLQSADWTVDKTGLSGHERQIQNQKFVLCTLWIQFAVHRSVPAPQPPAPRFAALVFRLPLTASLLSAHLTFRPIRFVFRSAHAPFTCPMMRTWWVHEKLHRTRFIFYAYVNWVVYCNVVYSSVNAWYRFRMRFKAVFMILETYIMVSICLRQLEYLFRFSVFAGNLWAIVSDGPKIFSKDRSM